MTTGSVIAGRGEVGLIVRPAEETVTRPIWLEPLSVNQRLPSGPTVIPKGTLAAVGMGNMGMGNSAMTCVVGLI